MIMSLIGGGLIALAFLAMAALRGGAAREPRPIWARSEMIESMVAIVLVCLIALGVSLIVNSVSGGWIPPLLGLAVALVGAIVAIMLAPRTSVRRSAPAEVV
jgi:membrane protein YdbS with pleckstrin-like domain